MPPRFGHPGRLSLRSRRSLRPEQELEILMPAWDYLAVSWSFEGPLADTWPARDAYQAGLDAALARDIPEDLHLPPEMDQLDETYIEWRSNAENKYLNDMGAAEYELVALHRDVVRERMLRWPYISVRAYFKRESRAGLPSAPPNPIGFRVRPSSDETSPSGLRKSLGRIEQGRPGLPTRNCPPTDLASVVFHRGRLRPIFLARADSGAQPYQRRGITPACVA